MNIEQLNRGYWFWIGLNTIAVTPYHLGKEVPENDHKDRAFKIFSVDENNEISFIKKIYELNIKLTNIKLTKETK